MITRFAYRLLRTRIACFLMLNASGALCQGTGPIRHPPILGMQFTLYNFKEQKFVPSFENTDAGLGIHYLRGIGPRWDAAFNLKTAFADSVFSHVPKSSKKRLLVQPDVSFRWRPARSLKAVSPYLQAGVGLSGFASTLGGFASTGCGAEVMVKDVFIDFSLRYNKGVSGGAMNHFTYSISVSGLIGKKPNVYTKKNSPPSIVGLSPRDSDGDGVLDSLDACPLVPGTAAFQGCPDSDGDGIEDRNDRCPTVFGVAAYNGCPVPDSDGDGINDVEDKCPTVPGIVAYYGCPVPDSDNDGVNDLEDSCRTQKGSLYNHGCPVDSFALNEQLAAAAQNIYFAFDRYDLLPASNRALNEVVGLLNANASAVLFIEGHTDNIGTRKRNLLLSQKRADAVKAYLVAHGIAGQRLQAVGYGPDRPIADNLTDEGRSQNRRVEFHTRVQE